MPDRRVLVVGEHQHLALPDLNDRDIATLADARGDLIRLRRRTSAGWEVELGPLCGVLELDTCRLVIEPRLMPSGATVAMWLSYALASAVQLKRLRSWDTSAEGLREIVIAALIEECGDIARAGLLRGYVRHNAEDTVLRGRLDIRRQLARRYGQVDRLHFEHHERDIDTWENLLCRAGLDLAARLSTDPALVRDARDLASVFPSSSPTDTDFVRRWLRTGTYHRLNARYRAAHHWTGLLIGGGGAADLLAPGRWPAGSLLIDMNRLWETAVARLCSEASPDAAREGAASAIVVREGHRQPRRLRPDAFVHSGGGLRPIDAKYKPYESEPVGRDDIHQLLTYASAFALPTEPCGTAIIVHPAGSNTRRTVGVTSQLRRMGHIAVVGLDVTQSPNDAARQLRALVSLPG